MIEIEAVAVPTDAKKRSLTTNEIKEFNEISRRILSILNQEEFIDNISDSKFEININGELLIVNALVNVERARILCTFNEAFPVMIYKFELTSIDLTNSQTIISGFSGQVDSMLTKFYECSPMIKLLVRLTT